MSLKTINIFTILGVVSTMYSPSALTPNTSVIKRQRYNKQQRKKYRNPRRNKPMHYDKKDRRSCQRVVR